MTDSRKVPLISDNPAWHGYIVTTEPLTTEQRLDALQAQIDALKAQLAVLIKRLDDSEGGK